MLYSRVILKVQGSSVHDGDYQLTNVDVDPEVITVSDQRLATFVDLLDGQVVTHNFRIEKTTDGYVIKSKSGSSNTTPRELNNVGDAITVSAGFLDEPASASPPVSGEPTQPQDILSAFTPLVDHRRSGDPAWPMSAVTKIGDVYYAVSAKGGQRRGSEWPKPDITTSFCVYGMNSGVLVGPDSHQVITGAALDATAVINLFGNHTDGTFQVDSPIRYNAYGYDFGLDRSDPKTELLLRIRGAIGYVTGVAQDTFVLRAGVNHLGYALRKHFRRALLHKAAFITATGAVYVNPVDGESQIAQSSDYAPIYYLSENAYNHQRVGTEQYVIAPGAEIFRSADGRIFAVMPPGAQVTVLDIIATLLLKGERVVLEEGQHVIWEGNVLLTLADPSERGQFEAMLRQTSELQSRISDLEGQLRESQRQAGEAQQLLRSAQATLDDVFTRAGGALGVQIDSSDSLESNIRSLSREADAHKLEGERVAATLQELLARLTSLVGYNVKGVGDLERAERAIGALRAAYSGDTAAIYHVVDDLVAELIRLRSTQEGDQADAQAIRQKDDEITRLRQQLQEMEISVRVQQDRANQEASRASELRELNASLQTQAQQMVSRLDQLRDADRVKSEQLRAIGEALGTDDPSSAEDDLSVIARLKSSEEGSASYDTLVAYLASRYPGTSSAEWVALIRGDFAAAASHANELERQLVDAGQPDAVVVRSTLTELITVIATHELLAGVEAGDDIRGTAQNILSKIPTECNSIKRDLERVTQQLEGCRMEAAQPRRARGSGVGVALGVVAGFVARGVFNKRNN